MALSLRGALRFLVAHHFDDELSRCVRLGPVPVCARCIGLYPVLAATLFAQLALSAPRELVIDPLWMFLAPAPALLDWRNGRYDPASGTNRWRLVTGALLGLGLGRALFVLLRFPEDKRPLVLLGILAGAALVVELRARRYRAELGP